MEKRFLANWKLAEYYITIKCDSVYMKHNRDEKYKRIRYESFETFFMTIAAHLMT